MLCQTMGKKRLFHKEDIMIIAYPNYLKDFICSGEHCKDTCCQSWEIQIDNPTWKKYQTFYKEREDWWKGKLNKKEKSLIFKNGKCQFLDCNGLCQIQKQYGFSSLCKTCKEYPRHLEIYGERKEWTLSLSCPEVAKLVLLRKEKVQFLSKEKEGVSPYEEELSKKEIAFYCDIREKFLEILQDRACSIKERIASILVLSHDIENKIKRGDYEAVNRIFAKYQREKETGKLSRKFTAYEVESDIKEAYVKTCMQLLQEMEPIDSKCMQIIDTVVKELDKSKEEQNKEQNRSNFPIEEELFYENLMVYFISVYVVGAVYDEELESKVKLAIFSYLIIGQVAQWLGEQEAVIEFVWKYSRQLEHSSQNLEWLEEILQTEHAFSYKSLLSCTLS